MQLGFLAAETTGLTVQPYWVLVAIVQFLILFFLLQRFLWGPIQKTLQARADRIREGLAAADAAKEERAQLQVEVERLLSEARREAAAIAERTTKAAEAAAAEIRAEAKAEGDRLRERAKADAEQLHQQALSKLRGEVASMAVLAASRILGKEVDASTHKVLIERSLDEAGRELGKQN
ncbi:MAG TPA: F0F1 ATP synthase subunit B [Candidatus Limnocylindria bacterium]|nr:F0F1 ATP synthase subunit B [Candidatus Limnocylindria bacterium]